MVVPSSFHHNSWLQQDLNSRLIGDILIALPVWNLIAKSEPIQTINSEGRKSTHFLDVPSHSHPQRSHKAGLPTWHPHMDLSTEGLLFEKCFISTRSKLGALKHIKMLQTFMAPYWGLVKLRYDTQMQQFVSSEPNTEPGQVPWMKASYGWEKTLHKCNTSGKTLKKY